MTSKAQWTTTRLLLTMILICAFLASPGLAQEGIYRDGAILETIETPHGNIHKIYRARPAASHKALGVPSFNGDSFSLEHQLGAVIDQALKCFDIHMSGMDDNTVLFDGITELLDPYLDGTQPMIFEFETTSLQGGETDAFFNSFADADLFPEGFEDPETGTPLDAACIEIGVDDTLDSNIPSQVTSALIEMSNADGTVLPPTDITNFFSSPFGGRLSVGITGLAGQGIDGTTLEMTMQQAPFDPQPIFSDGFESGDATAWTDEVP